MATSLSRAPQASPDISSLTQELTGFAPVNASRHRALLGLHSMDLTLQTPEIESDHLLESTIDELNRDLKLVPITRKGEHFQCRKNDSGDGLTFSLEHNRRFFAAELQNTLAEVSGNRRILKLLKDQGFEVSRVHRESNMVVMEVPPGTDRHAFDGLIELCKKHTNRVVAGDMRLQEVHVTRDDLEHIFGVRLPAQARGLP